MAESAPPTDERATRPDASFGRFVAICTVVTTLAGGVVGYVQSTASRSGNRAGSDAERLSVRSNAERERNLQLAYAVYDRFALWREQQAELANLTQRRLGLTSPPADPTLRAQEATIRTVAADTRRSISALARDHGLPDLTRAADFAPQGDPYFPSRFLAAAERRGVRLAALRDAAEEEESRWGADQASYLAVLTMFAVALYLFGFSLTPHAELRGIFVGAGLVLLVVGTAWAAMSYSTVPTRAPPAAAAEFATGHVAMRTAFQPADYRRAAEHFTRAIELRPSFARAYVERSDAVFLAGSPQRVGPASLTEPEARERYVDDIVKARELGTYTPQLLSDLAFAWFSQGVLDRDNELVDRSVEAAREAVDAAVERKEDTDAIPHFNLGAALLAAGRVDEAKLAYRTAVAKTSRDFIARQQTVAGALTDLDIVAQRGVRPVASAARRLKAFVMAETFKDDFAEESRGKPIEVTAKAGPGGLQLRGRGGPSSALCGRRVVAVWYYTPRADLGWFVPPDAITSSFRQCIPGLRGGAAESYVGVSYPASCLPDGAYRLELYDGDAVVAERRLSTRFRSAGAFEARDLGIRLCRPDRWKVWRGAQQSLSTAVIAPDGSRGVFVMRLTERVRRAARPRTLEAVLRRYSRLVGDVAGSEATGADRAFMDIPRPTTRRYVARGKEVLAGIGDDVDGSTVVGLVFGPQRWFATPAPGGLFEALALAYQPADG